MEDFAEIQRGDANIWRAEAVVPGFPPHDLPKFGADASSVEFYPSGLSSIWSTVGGV